LTVSSDEVMDQCVDVGQVSLLQFL
jgi:hypothetical protein